jgi:hypothetical protein
LAAIHPARVAAEGEAGQPELIVVVGAAGAEEFGTNFEASAAQWIKAAEQGGAHHVLIGLDPAGGLSDFDRLKNTLADEPKESLNELWIVLLGHGTFDGQEARFNLRGPDLSATDLAAWLKPFKRPLAILNCASASAPFLAKLSGPDRVVITATRSGYEQNYTRFGQYISEAITDPQADLDKDGQVSLLEAFLTASRRAAEFYAAEGRLATEHSLLDDNGDGLGTPADWFRGLRAVKRAQNGATLDGFRARQFVLVRNRREQQLSPALRAHRDELELAVAKLRETKETLGEEAYYQKLEGLLLELAKLSEQNSASP